MGGGERRDLIVVIAEEQKVINFWSNPCQSVPSHVIEWGRWALPSLREAGQHFIRLENASNLFETPSEPTIYNYDQDLDN